MRIRNAEGKSVLKTVGTASTLRGAKKLLQQARNDLAAGKLTTSPRQTVAHYLDTWVERKAPERRYATIRSYRRNCRLIKAEIGHVSLEELRKSHVRRLLEVLTNSGLSQQSVKRAHAVLHAALQDAMDDELIPRNPASERRSSQRLSQESGRRTLATSAANCLKRLTEPWTKPCSSSWLPLRYASERRWRCAGRTLTWNAR